MDWIIWLIVIVAIVGVVWWQLNRNSSRSRTGTATSKEAGSAAASAPSAGASSADAPAAAAPAATAPAQEEAGADNAAWETQWSETPPAETHAATHRDHAHHDHAAAGSRSDDMVAPAPGPEQPAGHTPVHHPEYTEPHAPTLPGAESAAAEVADVAEAETMQAASSAAAAEGFASHTAAPAGHLAAEQPYGEGSALPAADGSGPDGFTVKGNASSMIYHDETSPSYEETRAEVWFRSAAHAEAAGFRPPRRSRP